MSKSPCLIICTVMSEGSPALLLFSAPSPGVENSINPYLQCNTETHVVFWPATLLFSPP